MDTWSSSGQCLIFEYPTSKAVFLQHNLFVRFGWSSYVRVFTVIHYSTNRSLSHTYIGYDQETPHFFVFSFLYMTSKRSDLQTG